MLVAKPDVCAFWRDVIAARLIEDDQRDLSFNLTLARQYGLSVKPVEKLVAHTDVSGAIFRSNHASNHLPLGGTLPKDKQRILDALDGILAAPDAGWFRPQGMRGL